MVLILKGFSDFVCLFIVSLVDHDHPPLPLPPGGVLYTMIF